MEPVSLSRGERVGPYEITAAVGAGGMGEVYRATDTNLKRQVAIKVLPAALAADAERLARFQREAEVLASLNHPNIAAIFGLERAGGISALVMEFVDGATLADRIADGPIPLDEALRIARQIADALEAAHDRGIVHRDLKPANIKLRPDGTVKLLDFGLAKAIEAQTVGESAATVRFSPSRTVTSPAMLTDVGMILGTAAYMSPEQARSKPAETRSDIWAFGVVLAEMLTGRRLFERETVSDTIAAVLTHEPDLEDLPPAVRRLVRLCIAKDPRARLRHVGDALALVDDRDLPPTPRRARWFSPAYALLLIAFVAAALALAWLALRPRAVEREVTRFYVDAPPGAAFNYTYTASAVSPDGRQIVFRVATSAEAPALWVRPVDALGSRRIPGTEGGDFPFWSPDGRSLAFFSAGKLKRVDVSGGPAIVLCDASDADITATGGSWNEQGVIIFGAPQGIYRVSASGGSPVLAAAIDGTDETGYGAPQFLPDGDRFLMYVRSEDTARAGHYVTSLSHPQQKTLVLATNRKVLFVSDEAAGVSYLLYLQDRTLLARRVDKDTLALRGDPVPLASDVAMFPPGFHASFWSSASGSLLAYRTEASDKPRLTWVYPDGKRQNDASTEDFYTHVRTSADGSHAAMELGDGTGRNIDVWTWDFARRVKTRQTFDSKPDRAPTWAPDGRQIAFSSLRTGVWQIFRKNVDAAQGEEQLTTGPGDKIVPDWSRDGKYLLFVQIGTTTSEDIWALPLAGDRRPFPVLQTPALETNPALSHDGRWLAYESPESGRPEVFVTPFSGSHDASAHPAPRWQVSTQGGGSPRWSNDGRALFYMSLDSRSIMRADVRTRSANLESDLPRLFAEIPLMPGARSPFDVTADGRVLVLERTINQGAPLAVVTNWVAGIPVR